MTTVCKILWMILASKAILHHLSSQAPLSVHAMRASVHIARDSMKETIDSKIPLRFRDSESTSDQEDLPQQYPYQHPYRYAKQQQNLMVPHDGYQLVHVHYHYDGRDSSVGKDATPGCEKTHKRSKQIRIGGMDGEDDCGTTTPTSSPSPSSESSPAAVLPEIPYYSPSNSTLSPTSAGQLDPEKPWNPTDNRTSGTLSAFPSESPSQVATSNTTEHPTADSTFIDTFVVEFQHPASVTSQAPSLSPTNAPTKNLRTPTTTHDVNVLAEDSGSNSGSFSMGKSYWVVGAAICITAFLGGFATSKICSKRTNHKNKSNNQNKNPRDEETGNLADHLGNQSGTQNEDDSSVQFSVEESVDSYHLEDCDDWSVSVMSWSPRETEEPSIEVERRIKLLPSGDANDKDDEDDLVATSRDEIEIEFYDIDLEGYQNALEVHHHEVEPPLFDVIKLSEHKASF